ncbi:107-domain-containing protein [Phycomyces blakesleeanus]|uniref:Nuclear pore complex protein n=1 Tax=Phycomyces blakesleeanus TaxID=4837 RepID=A0ABR3AYW5_PHYBL
MSKITGMAATTLPADDTILEHRFTKLCYHLKSSPEESALHFPFEMRAIVQNRFQYSIIYYINSFVLLFLSLSLSRFDSASSKQPSPLWHCLYIKSWLEETTKANLTEDRSPFGESDDDMEDEIPVLNSNIKAKEQARQLKKRRLDSFDRQDLEAYYITILKLIRRGQFDELTSLASQHTDSRKVFFIHFADLMKKAEDGIGIEWKAEKRKMWKKMCDDQLKDKNLGPYGKAVFSAITGRTEHLLPVCETWEDVIWSYNNACLQATIEKFLSHQPGSDDVSVPSQPNDITYLPLEIASLANGKDILLSKKTIFLSSKPLELIDCLYTICVDKKWNALSGISENPKLQDVFLRVAASFALYVQVYYKIDDPKINSLLECYATKLADRSFDDMAMYTSTLPSDLQTSFMARFFKNFDGDKKACSELVKIARKYRVDISSVLECIFVLYMTEFVNKQAVSQSSLQENYKFELEGALSKNDRICLKAVGWLSMDNAMANNLIERINGVLRYLLATRQIGLAYFVAISVPVSYLNTFAIYADRPSTIPDVVSEFYYHRSVIEILRIATIEALDAIQKAREDFRNLTKELSEKIKAVLNSKWLRVSSTEKEVLKYMDWDLEPALIERLSNAELRKVYITQLVFYLHDLYFDTSDIFEQHCKDSLNLMELVSQGHHGIYKDIEAAGKTSLLLQRLCKSKLKILEVSQ